MSRLPCPEEYEMAGLTMPESEAGSSLDTSRGSMSPLEGLLMYYGRFVNQMSVRGTMTPVEQAVLESGQRFFQELADSCAEMAVNAHHSSSPQDPQHKGFVNPDFLATIGADDYVLESAGGSSVAAKKTSTKKTPRKKTKKKTKKTKRQAKKKKKTTKRKPRSTKTKR